MMMGLLAWCFWKRKRGENVWLHTVCLDRLLDTRQLGVVLVFPVLLLLLISFAVPPCFLSTRYHDVNLALDY